MSSKQPATIPLKIEIVREWRDAIYKIVKRFRRGTTKTLIDKNSFEYAGRLVSGFIQNIKIKKT